LAGEHKSLATCSTLLTNDKTDKQLFIQSSNQANNHIQQPYVFNESEAHNG